MNDFSPLEETKHMLNWLAEGPYDNIFNKVESMLNQQIEGSKLIYFKVTSEPQWLTMGRKEPEDETKMILMRTGVAFEFDMEVAEPSDQRHQLIGVYSWVGINLDQPPDDRLQRMWMDVNVDLSTHGKEGALRPRMFFEEEE